MKRPSRGCIPQPACKQTANAEEAVAHTSCCVLPPSPPFPSSGLSPGAYVERIQQVVGVPIAWIGTGPGRHEMILQGVAEELEEQAYEDEDDYEEDGPEGEEHVDGAPKTGLTA